MAIKTTYIVLRTEKPVLEPPSKLRGYIADRFPNYKILHNYIEEKLLHTSIKETFLFNWESIPEKDSDLLINFLKEDLNINWVDNAKIFKTDGGKSILLFTEQKSIKMVLDENKKKAWLKINDGRTYNLIVREENGALNIYKERSDYTYPRVQYKMLEGTAAILGIEEGARVIKEISDSIDSLVLGNSTYNLQQKILYDQEVEIKPTEDLIQYRFISPWLALKPKNYEKFMGLHSWKEKKEMLNRILIGNILSMCKGFGITVDKNLHAHTHLEMEMVIYEGIKVIGFTGDFRINFEIPQFFGIGKGISQGFGVVKPV